MKRRNFIRSAGITAASAIVSPKMEGMSNLKTSPESGVHVTPATVRVQDNKVKAPVQARSKGRDRFPNGP